VICPYVVDQSIKYYLNLVVLGDMLMFSITAVFAKQCKSVDIFLELLNLLRFEFIQDIEEFFSDEFGPIKSLFVIMIL